MMLAIDTYSTTKGFANVHAIEHVRTDDVVMTIVEAGHDHHPLGIKGLCALGNQSTNFSALSHGNELAIADRECLGPRHRLIGRIDFGVIDGQLRCLSGGPCLCPERRSDEAHRSGGGQSEKFSAAYGIGHVRQSAPHRQGGLCASGAVDARGPIQCAPIDILYCNVPVSLCDCGYQKGAV